MAAKTSRQAGSNRKFVYFFGDGKADGTGKMKNLLGGKGANLAEMSKIGIPVHHGCLHVLLHARTAVSLCLAKTDRGKPTKSPEGHGYSVWERAKPAPSLGPFGCPRVDARDDGNGSEPRPERPDRGRPHKEIGE